MLLRGALLLQLRHQGLRLLVQHAHLGQVEPGGGAHIDAAAEDAQRLGAVVQRALRERQAFVGLLQGQPGVGGLRHQADRGALLRPAGGKVLAQRRVAEVAHAAPQVQLPAADADGGAVAGQRAGHHGGHGWRQPGTQVVGQAYARHAGAGAHAGQFVGALDAIGGAGLGHAQRGQAQVAVVGQRLGDDGLQGGVGEIVAPVVDCGLRAFGIGGLRILLRHGHGRRHVAWRERGAARQQQRRGGHAGRVPQGAGRSGVGVHVLAQPMMCTPASTYSVLPVMERAASLKRKAHRAPTSSMSTRRPSGARCTASAMSCSNCAMPDAARVATGPGETALTRMPAGPSSAARYRTEASSAALTGPMSP